MVWPEASRLGQTACPMEFYILSFGPSWGPIWLMCSIRENVDPPVALDRSPSKLKILGIYVGLGNLEDDNWCPRINAAEKTLLSWRQRNPLLFLPWRGFRV